MTVTEVAETRTKRRDRVNEAGLIRFGDLSVCCAIRNISETGAALDIGFQNRVPDSFTLIIARKKKIYSCTVVWRKGVRVGVSFF
jgi:PilZ domain-containing protein